MNCKQNQKWILLNDSGELSAAKNAKLDLHLSHCALCRNFQKQMATIRTTTVPDAMPTEKIMTHIRREARQQTPQQKRVTFPFVLKPVFIGVAASLLILFAITLKTKITPPALELVLYDTQLWKTQDQVNSIIYNGFSDDDLAFNFLMTYEEEES